jgi:hypothetical protein
MAGGVWRPGGPAALASEDSAWRDHLRCFLDPSTCRAVSCVLTVWSPLVHWSRRGCGGGGAVFCLSHLSSYSHVTTRPKLASLPCCTLSRSHPTHSTLNGGRNLIVCHPHTLPSNMCRFRPPRFLSTHLIASILHTLPSNVCAVVIARCSLGRLKDLWGLQTGRSNVCIQWATFGGRRGRGGRCLFASSRHRRFCSAPYLGAAEASRLSP